MRIIRMQRRGWRWKFLYNDLADELDELDGSFDIVSSIQCRHEGRPPRRHYLWWKRVGWSLIQFRLRRGSTLPLVVRTILRHDFKCADIAEQINIDDYDVWKHEACYFSHDLRILVREYEVSHIISRLQRVYWCYDIPDFTDFGEAQQSLFLAFLRAYLAG
jgi:hypothetical protein